MPPGLILGRPMARPSIGSLLRLAAVDTRPLRRRDFSLLFCGQLVSHLGTMVTAVAVPFQLYQLTHSSLAVGVLGAASGQRAARARAALGHLRPRRRAGGSLRPAAAVAGCAAAAAGA